MRVASTSEFNTIMKSNYRKAPISVSVEGIANPFTEADIKYFKIDSKDIPGRTFGVSYCHQFKIVFKDSITVSKGDSIKISFIYEDSDPQPHTVHTVSYPTFYADEVISNDVTKETTIIGYDKMVKANDIKYAPVEGNIDAIANGVASQLGTTVLWLGNTTCKPSQSTTWTVDKINTDENASLRSIIKAIAEITGTIAYINADDKLVFRGLTTTTITDATKHFYNYEYELKLSDYYKTDKSVQQTISGIAHKNELNDATTVGTLVNDCIVLYSNPFLSLLEELDKENILNNVLTHIQTTCLSSNISHLGNPALELGDPIKIYDTDQHSTSGFFYLQETLEYNGGLKATGGWEYAEQDSTDLPPSSVTQDNKITRATVDKVNNRIELVTGEENNQAYIKLEAINNAPTYDPQTGTYIGIRADQIQLDGSVYLSNWASDDGQGNYTKIDGSVIYSGQIQSVGYQDPTSSSKYAKEGSQFDLTNGKITTKNFYSDSSGAGFKGNLEADDTRFKKLSIYKEIPASDPNDPPTTWETSMYAQGPTGAPHFEIRTETGLINSYISMDGENVTIASPDGGIDILGGPDGVDISGDVSTDNISTTDLTATNATISNLTTTGNVTIGNIGSNADLLVRGYITAENLPDPTNLSRDGKYYLYVTKVNGEYTFGWDFISPL